MYITTYSCCSCSSSRAHSSPSITNHCRSFSISSAFRSVPRWSDGVDWKSPASLISSEGSPPSSEHAFKGILTGLPKPGGGEYGKFYSLPALNDPRIDMLAYSITILLESAIRNCDNFQVTKEDVEKKIDWENTSPKQVEIPVKPACVLLQDFTGVPALVDLACMRDAMNKLGSDSKKINPLRSENAVQANMELEFQRNKERFAFLKWGSNAFQNMIVVPPGSGIVHQGVAGWGVGGIEAEAAMLGQRYELFGKLRNGVTATDLVLTVTQMLRKHGVVGKFVEFYGEGVGKISLADRATIANMSPEYGATMGFFPVDHVTLQYLNLTGRSEETVAMIEAYLRANNMFVDYNENKVVKFSFHGQPAELIHGSVVIAAITSCTNTSNPSVMLGAGLVAKKVCELGLQVKSWIKTSLAPGSGVVTKYLLQSGLQKYLNEHGFHIVGCGCTTCIGNSGDLDESVASAI
ncbi:unnamed protein product [Camellia sinensis]